MWESERFDWKRLRSATSAEHVPDAVARLRDAADESMADAAYWKIDNEVVVQGLLYEAALPACSCLLQALLHCSPVARSRILELLVQLGAGTPHPSELTAGNLELARRCRKELLRSSVVFFDLLEAADQEWADFCVDLLMICSEEDPSLLEKVRWYFNRLLLVGTSEPLGRLIRGWLSGADGREH